MQIVHILFTPNCGSVADWSGKTANNQIHVATVPSNENTCIYITNKKTFLHMHTLSRSTTKKKRKKIRQLIEHVKSRF